MLTLAKAKPALKQYAKVVLRAIYPRRCPFCGKVQGQAVACQTCAQELSALCLVVPRLPRTEHCLNGLTDAACAYRYHGTVKTAVARLKQESNAHYAQDMAALMLQHIYGCICSCKRGIIICENTLPFVEYDCVVPVPPSANRDGYSGQALLAQYIAEVFGIPCLPNALMRVRPTEKQVGKTAQQRRKNVKNAFAVSNPEEIAGKRVLLVDDVITTGATVSECALALGRAEALQVFAVAFAQTQYESDFTKLL